jgi:hypothetical protein
MKMLIHLSVTEPGENCKPLHPSKRCFCWPNRHKSLSLGLNKEFMFDRGFLPMPGWDLNITWLSEEGLPRKGLLSFELFAGDGIKLLGCAVDVRLRMMLSSLVLVGQRDYPTEIERGDLLTEERSVEFVRGMRNPVSAYPQFQMNNFAVQPSASMIAAANMISNNARPTSGKSGSSSTATSSMNAGSSPQVSSRPKSSKGQASGSKASEGEPTGMGQIQSALAAMGLGGNHNGMNTAAAMAAMGKPLFAQLKLITQCDLLSQVSLLEAANDLPVPERMPSAADLSRPGSAIPGQGSAGVSATNSRPTSARLSRPLSASSHAQQQQMLKSNTAIINSNLSAFEVRRYTYDDCNRHLLNETDITWSYTTDTGRYESWVVK